MRIPRSLAISARVVCHALATLLLGVVVTGVSPHAHAFDLAYRYELVTGREIEVCRHMAVVFNKRFVRPWSDETNGGLHSSRDNLSRTQYSRIPTSPEYDAIKWNVHSYIWNGSNEPLLYSEFDIDNDGTKDTVLKVSFFDGTPGSWDYFDIYPAGAIDIARLHTRVEYESEFMPKRLAELGYPLHQRPFIFKGTTYLSGYTYTPRKYRGANPAEPFGPPEFLLIRKHLGGPARDAVEQDKARSMVLVCKFKMIQLRDHR